MPNVDHSLVADCQKNGFVAGLEALTDAELKSSRHRMREIADGVGAAFPASSIELEPQANGIRSQSTVRKINQCAEHDELFMTIASSDRILETVALLIGPDIKLFGSQCFMKPPGGIEKPYHQDSAYFTIEPRNVTTCWIALDDVTLDNGCLWVIPGSHQGELLDHDEPWKVGDRVDMQVRGAQFDRTQESPIELKSGHCSFHHSMLLHRSGPNSTTHPRRGLAIHYMSSQSRWTHPVQPQPNYVLLRGREYDGCV